MIRRVSVALLVLVCLLGMAAQSQAKKNGSPYPSIVGTWEVTPAGHHRDHGFKNEPPGRVTIAITAQEGPAFTGTKTWKSLIGEQKSTAFSGVFDPSGKEAYVAEHDDGFAFLKGITGKSMVYIYLESGVGGSPKAVVSTLKKVK